MDYSMPDFPIFNCLPDFAQIHVHWVRVAIQHLFSSFPQSFPASESFLMSQFFTSGGQSIGALASASILPMNVKVANSCPTLCDPMNYTVHGILQARILEWVDFPFSRGPSQPRKEPMFPALQADSLPAEPQEKYKNMGVGNLSFLQWIFPTQESNRGLLHCRLILYQMSYQRSPNIPMNSQVWFPLGFPGLIFLQPKVLSRAFSNFTIWKHQFFDAQPSLWSNSCICLWLLEKP